MASWIQIKRLSTVTLLLLSTSVFAITSVDRNINLQRKKVNLIAGYTYHATSVATQETSNTIDASGSLTVMGANLGGDYFIYDNLTLGGTLFFAIITDIDSDVTGLDIGLRWYFLKPGYKHEASILGAIIETSPAWSPYLYVGYVNRSYQFSDSNLTFQGFGIEAGTDYHLGQDFYIRAGFQIKNTKNNVRRTASTTGLNLGIGYSF
jgi:opacity protein-like surface antigen